MTHIFLLLENNVFRAQIKIKSYKSFAKPISHQLINIKTTSIEAKSFMSMFSANLNCDTTELLKWNNVEVENSGIPISHGKNVTIKCKKRHINLGGRELECSCGTFQVAPDNSEPNCTKVGMFDINTCTPIIVNSTTLTA